MIKAIIFDFDNTLANRQDYADHEFRLFVKEHFPYLDENSIEFECVVQDMVNWDGFGNSNKTYLAKQLVEKYKIDFDVNTYKKWWVDHMLDYVSIYEDTIDVLEYLKPKYKLAILTNGGKKPQRGKVKLSGIESYMDYVIASGELHIHKPDTRIYQYVCEQLQIQPEEAIFIGDTFSTDLLGAYRVGMKPIWICADKYRKSNGSVQRIYSLSELKNIL